jgi:hypothetical protein
MTELHMASRQWASRPADERFTSLHALAAFTKFRHDNCARLTIANRDIDLIPSTTDVQDIAVVPSKDYCVRNGKSGRPAQLTHWSFTQLCGLAAVPAGYLRHSHMPGALAADNLNWGLHHSRKPESVSMLLRRNNGGWDASAFNGPDYGPVWDADIVDTLVNEFGDGVTGDWTVPGEFGKRLENVTQANTTLYASDRDMWVFLADEERRIELPSRRAGKSGSFARGFYISNSEVGARTLTLGTFLFDYVCCNRIIWGATQHSEIKIRHTAAAPHRWLEEVKPVLKVLSEQSPQPMQDALRAAQQEKIKGDITKFLETRFGSSSTKISAIHELEEQRPIETMWDAAVGATAFARGITHQDERVRVERIAGELLMQRTHAADIQI